MTTDKPKNLRNFSISKSFGEVHTILDTIGKQDRSRFICEAIIEKYNAQNATKEPMEPMEQMKKMMEQYHMIASIMNPPTAQTAMQQPIYNPAMMQMMQQPMYQQPMFDPMLAAQMQAQTGMEQVHTTTHAPVNPAPVEKPIATTVVEPTLPIQAEEVVDDADTVKAYNEKDKFSPQGLFESKEDEDSVEATSTDAKTNSKPINQEEPDARIERRRRGVGSRQFMND